MKANVGAHTTAAFSGYLGASVVGSSSEVGLVSGSTVSSPGNSSEVKASGMIVVRVSPHSVSCVVLQRMETS